MTMPPYGQPPAAPTPPTPAKLPKGCAAATVVIAIIVVIAIGVQSRNLLATSGTSTPAAPAPAPATAAQDTTTPASTPDLGPRAALADWYTNGGKAQIDQLSNDMNTISNDSSKQDTASLAVDCTALGGDVAGAQNYAPLPDTQAQASWASGLRHLSQGATDCADAANTLDAARLSKGADEISAGTKDMNALAARIKAVSAGQ